LLTALVLVGFPAINFIYWPELLRSGAFLPDGDSIAVPMFGGVLATLFLSPLILGISWLCLRRYNPDARLLSWRPDRPFRSAALTVLFGSAAALVTAGILVGLTSARAWFEFLWPSYLAFWLPWLLGLRAAAVDQLAYDPREI
jgi:hypothetical protein